MADGGISEAASKNTADGLRKVFKDAPDALLLDILSSHATAEAKTLAGAILSEREGASKKRKGRPRILSKGMHALCKGVNPEIKTARGLLDVNYRLRAMNVVKRDDGCKWLFDEEAAMRGEKIKSSILTELGRIEDDEVLLAVAVAVCKMKPKTKDAITRIRRARLDKAAPPDALTLANRLIRTINEYMAAHPGMTDTDVLNALATARNAVAKSLSEAASDNED